MDSFWENVLNPMRLLLSLEKDQNSKSEVWVLLNAFLHHQKVKKPQAETIEVRDHLYEIGRWMNAKLH